MSDESAQKSTAGDLEDYILYVQNVLGVRNVILNSSQAHPHAYNSMVAEEESAHYDLHVSIQGFASYSDDEKDLLQKMLGAMKLESLAVYLSDSDVPEAVQSSFNLIFRDQPQVGHETYSPRILLTKPELKKQAWADMQNIVKQLAGVNS